ncbi:1819_t:CDS:1, partial [Gigaspora margarita]
KRLKKQKKILLDITLENNLQANGALKNSNQAEHCQVRFRKRAQTRTIFKSQLGTFQI